MAVALHMGVEAVTYQPSMDPSPTDYPRRKINLPVSASIPSHVDRVFALDASDHQIAGAVAPRISNPYVTAPARYRELFGEIETATDGHAGATGEEARIVASARALLLAMRADFETLDTSRNALVKA